MKKGLITGILLTLILIILITGCTRRAYEETKATRDQNKNEWVDDIKITGTGSCTEREECEKMLGKGAFCSNGKCFPAPEDYVEGVAICNCPDGTKIKTTDCRWVDCPGTPTTPTEFTVKDGLVPKTTVSVNFPLSDKEAKKVAMAACGISAETSEPASPYENIISECSPAWSFLDDTNPCNLTQAYVCGDKAFASCIFGGETAKQLGLECFLGQPFIQGEYHEKFIVANPVDLSQIKKLSKFRGCTGHDYSGYNDKSEPETERSMKHYAPAIDGVKIMNMYAPFNGTIVNYFVSPFPTPGYNTEHEMWIRGDHSGKWFIMFGHVTAKEGLNVGSRVTAGELIATTIVEDSYDGTEFALNQDISTETKKEQFVRGAPLDYMTDEVLAEYASYGLTSENVVFTKEYRDAHPCDWAKPTGTDDYMLLNSD